MAQSAQLRFNEQPAAILYSNTASVNKASSTLTTFTPDEKAFYYHSTAFYYKNRARLHFNVSREFSEHFVLVKGLIEFYRPSQLRFAFAADRKGMEIDLDVNQFEALHKLFRAVYAELLKEIHFKAELKKAIEFEQRYKRERAEVYMSVS